MYSTVLLGVPPRHRHGSGIRSVVNDSHLPSFGSMGANGLLRSIVRQCQSDKLSFMLRGHTWHVGAMLKDAQAITEFQT